MLYSSEISPTRCNNCVFILRNGFYSTCRVKPLRRIKTQLLHLVGLISQLLWMNVAEYYWKPCNNGAVPQDAFVGGLDKDGSRLYVGRALHQGDMLPAKIAPSHRCAFVCYGGTEHRVLQYEVRWRRCRNSIRRHTCSLCR